MEIQNFRNDEFHSLREKKKLKYYSLREIKELKD